MGRKKGTPKTGGRQAGTPNRITGDLRGFVANLIDDNREQIKEDIKVLRPAERLSFLERMMQYVLPKQQALKASVNTGLSGCFQIKTKHLLDGKEISDEEYNKLMPDFPNSEDEIDDERDWRGFPNIISEVYLEKD